MVHLCFNESLCKTVKWHRVPVLSYRWWISAHHAEQSVIIQLTSKSSHSGIAQEIFWDIWNRTESIDSSEDFVTDDARKIPVSASSTRLSSTAKALQLGVPMESGVGKISD